MAIGKDYEKQVEPATTNKAFYCQKHGYSFIYLNHSLDKSRPIPWSKILVIKDALKSGLYDWVFWSDADSIITNLDITLQSLIDEQYDFIITRDFNNINSGHFLIKNSEWSLKFLDDIYSHTELIHHSWWENKAIIVEYDSKSEVQKHTKIIPQRKMNSYSGELLKSSKIANKEGVFISPEILSSILAASAKTSSLHFLQLILQLSNIIRNLKTPLSSGS